MTGGNSRLKSLAAMQWAGISLADRAALRLFNIALAFLWAALFVLLALRYDLQLYGDGSIFSYAIALQEGWAFHWHNIAGRSFVYLYAHLPAEAFAALTGNANGAITLYGLLFFSAPLLGLLATYALDRSHNRRLLSFACLSTTAVMPFVFGFPTEMWIAHALYWPALTYALHAPLGARAQATVAVLLTALGMTHGGGTLLALSIVIITALRGFAHPVFLRALLAMLPAVAVWAFVQATFKPDAYIADALAGAAFNFVNLRNFDLPVTRLLAAALAAYTVLFAAGRRMLIPNVHLKAAALVAIALVAYWRLWDESLLTEMRYPLRTALLVVPPILGFIAAAYALKADDAIGLRLPLLEPALAVLRRTFKARFLAGALMLMALVHAVETAKFMVGWEQYKKGVANLAMSQASDPALGSARFISSTRIGAYQNQYGWGSTTHFLSVLLAPRHLPNRLVIDPDTNYFWLTCATATASERTGHAIPFESRHLIKLHACLHR